MMKLAILSATFGAARAFTPLASQPASSSLPLLAETAEAVVPEEPAVTPING